MRFLSLLLLFALSANAATIAFKDIPSTNVVNTSDQLLLNSNLGGGNYATRTITVSALPHTGSTNWVDSGTTNATLAGVASANVFSLGGPLSTNWNMRALPAQVDFEGGTAYGVQFANPFSDNLANPARVAFATSDLTNFWGIPTLHVSIGDSVPDPMTFATNNNIAIWNLGFFCGQSMVASDSTYIFNLLDTAGVQMTISNAFDVVNAGESAGLLSTIINSGMIFNWGQDTFSNSTIRDSNDIHTGGFYNYGRAAGSLMNLTNSGEIYTWGSAAGLGLSGSNRYRLYLLGHNATATLNSDQMVFGDSSVANYNFPGTGTITTAGSYTSGAPSGGTAAAWKLGSYKTNAVTVVATNYVEVEIGGVLRKLAIVQ